MDNFSTLWEAEWGGFFAFPLRQVWKSVWEHSADVLLQIHKPDPPLTTTALSLFPCKYSFNRAVLLTATDRLRIYAQSVRPNLPKPVISCAQLCPRMRKHDLKSHICNCRLLSLPLALASKQAEDDPEQPQQPMVRNSSWRLPRSWDHQHWQLCMSVYISTSAETPTWGRRHAMRWDMCLATADTLAAADWPVYCHRLQVTWLNALFFFLILPWCVHRWEERSFWPHNLKCYLRQRYTFPHWGMNKRISYLKYL